MGLINNWLHKKDKDQLSKAGEKKSPAAVVAKKEKPQAGDVEKKKVEKKKVKEHDHAEHEVQPVKSTVKVSAHSSAFKVLVKPLVTEKSAIAESKGKYSFVVAKFANKEQVKLAVAEIYGVKPVRVNMANIEGRAVRFGRAAGRRGDYKKAVVTLPEGKTIDIHAGV
jgi:large subunit ribosomal protein L23